MKFLKFTYDHLQKIKTVDLEGKVLIYHDFQFLNPQCFYVYDTYLDKETQTCTLNLLDTDNNVLGSIFIKESDELHFKEYGHDIIIEIVRGVNPATEIIKKQNTADV